MRQDTRENAVWKGEEMLKLNTIEHAFLYVENGRIVDYGPRVDKPQIGRDVLVVDAEAWRRVAIVLRFPYSCCLRR